MKAPRVEPAAWAPGADGVPASVRYRDRYRPAGDPSAQARQVFLAGNGLPSRWAGLERFTVLETGFGLGHNFLATWAAWAADPRRPAHLSFVSIERHPLARDELVRAWPPEGDPAEARRRNELREQWPVLTPDLHRLVFAGGHVELLLALGDVHDWLPRLELRADAVFLDGFAPDRNPAMWDLRVARGLARLAAPEATLSTWSTARAVREALGGAGFETERVTGMPPKRQMLVGRRHPASARAARELAGGVQGAHPARHACIVGAGLAGCAAAIALVRLGWTVEMIDAAPHLAAGASGTPAGIFHGTVLADDGPHARWNRAATLDAAREYARLIADHGVPGAVDGLLRLERELEPPAMAHRLETLGWPSDHARALDVQAAAEWAGLPAAPPSAGAWALGQAGWVSPAAVCDAWRREAGGAWSFRGDQAVAALRRGGEGQGEVWAVIGADGQVLAQATAVVVAAAGRAAELLAPHCDAATWPAGQIRGQVSWLEAGLAAGAIHDGVPGGALRRPVAGGGYAVSLPDGRLLFGATAQPGDAEAAARLQDDRFNLARLAALGLVDGARADREAADWLASGQLGHRVGWRWTTADRLPLVGPVATGLQAGRVERVPGLHLIGGFGSRGLTWAPLAGALLAARLTGSPWPVERPVADRLDPARFALARARRNGADRSGLPPPVRT